MVLAQRWPDAVQPTKYKGFQQRISLCWPNVCPTLKSQHKQISLYVAYYDVAPTLALRCASNPNYQPNVQRFANVGST